MIFKRLGLMRSRFYGWYSIQTDKRNSVDVGIKIAA